NTIAMLAQPSNDVCSFATDIQSFINQQGQSTLAGPYSNVGATGNDLDIAGITGCWLDDLTGNADGSSPQIDATVWFRFEGYDGEVMLYVQPCDSNLTFLSQDTQMALYSGECDTLELVACNEDIDAAMNNYWSGLTTNIVSGSTYYLAVDGFNYSGFGSPELPLTTGEFCLSFAPPAVSIEEIRETTVQVFPNPMQGIMHVRSEAFIRELTIFNGMGQLCEAYSPYQCRSFDWDVALSPGVYTLLVRTESGTTVHRIIKN
ncbi:MAG: T9SS type A sorting domain-containing protein, partial [Flavobacteriales bacterium]